MLNAFKDSEGGAGSYRCAVYKILWKLSLIQAEKLIVKSEDENHYSNFFVDIDFKLNVT